MVYQHWSSCVNLSVIAVNGVCLKNAVRALTVLSSSIADTKFDLVIGHIEDMIMDENFQAMQDNFMEKYYAEFEDTEECKFIYSDIHHEYISLIERYIETELCSRIEGFSMEEFHNQLLERKDELEGEVFEMLLTFGDFVAFKEMFIDYRKAKDGITADLTMGITVTPFNDNHARQLQQQSQAQSQPPADCNQ